MLPNVFTWMPLPHLPKVPDHFIKMAYQKVDNPEEQFNKNFALGITNQAYMDRRIIYKGKEIGSHCQVSFDLGPLWEDWVRENIHPVFEDTGVRLSWGDSGVGGAHVDNPGKIRFFYLLERGGDDAETVFYYHPDIPFIFDMDKWDKKYPFSYDNIDELFVVERAKFPLHTWILFNGYTLHGVEGIDISLRRINFNVSVKPETFTHCVKPV
jgi:hypothetical protein